jgi:hypothetical protein
MDLVFWCARRRLLLLMPFSAMWVGINFASQKLLVCTGDMEALSPDDTPKYTSAPLSWICTYTLGH